MGARGGGASTFDTSSSHMEASQYATVPWDEGEAALAGRWVCVCGGVGVGVGGWVCMGVCVSVSVYVCV